MTKNLIMKSYLTKSFLLVLSLLFSFQSFSQIGSLGPILNDNDGGGNIVWCLNSDATGGDYSITPVLTIAIANLDLFLPNSHTDKDITYDYLPSNRPTMFLRYSVNGGPYERVNLSEIPFKHLKTRNGVNLYYAFVETYEINLDSQCQGNTDGGGNFPFEIHLEEYTEIEPDYGQGNIFGYAPYPACDYTAPSDIFSCNVFIPAPLCVENGDPTGEPPFYQECHNQDLTSRIGTIPYDCNCGIGEPDTYDEEGFNGNGDHRNEQARISSNFNDEFLIQPNPFINNFELSWTFNDTVENISMIDTNGRLIKFWNKNQLIDKTSLDIETGSLSKGLYFIKMKTTNSNKVIKVVKQ